MDETPHAPKVCLGLLVKDGKFLLIQRKTEIAHLKWAFPGGVTHPGESEEDAAVREVWEETNAKVKVVEKLLERKHPDTFVTVAYFHCEEVEPTEIKVNDSEDIITAEWVPANEVLERFTTDVDPKIREFVTSQSK